MPYKSKKKKKYQQGGMMSGPSHISGGIDINVEGGEYMIKKDSVNPQTEGTLEYINEYGELPMEGVNSMPRVVDKITGEVAAETEDYSDEAVAEMQSIADSDTNLEVEYETQDASMMREQLYAGGGKTGYNKIGMYEKGGKVKK